MLAAFIFVNRVVWQGIERIPGPGETYDSITMVKEQSIAPTHAAQECDSTVIGAIVVSRLSVFEVDAFALGQVTERDGLAALVFLYRFSHQLVDRSAQTCGCQGKRRFVEAVFKLITCLDTVSMQNLLRERDAASIIDS
jgi:hypothetical protein